MDTIYNRLAARYDLTQILLSCLIFFNLILTLYLSSYHPQRIATIQRECGPVLILSAGVLMSLFHATCLWIVARHMLIRQDHAAKQQGISDHQRRLFGLSRRHIYSRYIGPAGAFGQKPTVMNKTSY